MNARRESQLLQCHLLLTSSGRTRRGGSSRCGPEAGWGGEGPWAEPVFSARRAESALQCPAERWGGLTEERGRGRQRARAIGQPEGRRLLARLSLLRRNASQNSSGNLVRLTLSLPPRLGAWPAFWELSADGSFHLPRRQKVGCPHGPVPSRLGISPRPELEQRLYPTRFSQETVSFP